MSKSPGHSGRRLFFGSLTQVAESWLLTSEIRMQVPDDPPILEDERDKRARPVSKTERTFGSREHALRLPPIFNAAVPQQRQGLICNQSSKDHRGCESLLRLQFSEGQQTRPVYCPLSVYSLLV